mgnify:CR=1 FL=1
MSAATALTSSTAWLNASSLAREGLFDDLDAVLAWHPGDKTEGDMVSSQAMVDLKAMYEKDHPGVTIEWTIKSTPETTQIVLTQPDSFDIFSGYYHQLDQTWPAGNLQAIPTSAMTRFSEISPLPRLPLIA